MSEEEPVQIADDPIYKNRLEGGPLVFKSHIFGLNWNSDLKEDPKMAYPDAQTEYPKRIMGVRWGDPIYTPVYIGCEIKEL